MYVAALSGRPCGEGNLVLIRSRRYGRERSHVPPIAGWECLPVRGPSGWGRATGHAAVSQARCDVDEGGGRSVPFAFFCSSAFATDGYHR
jgi:hypothetical protein